MQFNVALFWFLVCIMKRSFYCADGTPQVFGARRIKCKKLLKAILQNNLYYN